MPVRVLPSAKDTNTWTRFQANAFRATRIAGHAKLTLPETFALLASTEPTSIRYRKPAYKSTTPVSLLRVLCLKIVQPVLPATLSSKTFAYLNACLARSMTGSQPDAPSATATARLARVHLPSTVLLANQAIL